MTDAAAASVDGGRMRGWATALVLLLALLMAVRLCMTETLGETLQQKAERLAAAVDPEHHVVPVVAGPATTLGFACLAMALAGAAAAVAAMAGTLSAARVLRWAVVAGIAALGWASIHTAANRFSALVGTADVVGILAAGWAVGVLCHARLAGDRGRRIVLAAAAAVLAAWVVQGLNYHFVDGPEAIASFEKDRDAQLRQLGITPGSARDILYESRMRSGELEGYMTLANVTAAGFVGLLAVMAGLVVVTGVAEGKVAHAKGQLPAGLLFAGGGVVVIVLGGYALSLTQSNGGMAMGVACVGAVVVGVLLRHAVSRWRWVLTGLAIGGFVLGMAGVVGYGMAKHRLPGKSLTFRWFYWSGAARMIEAQPLTGVGMNNFGSWYLTEKRPDAPEDVSDPHNYFVRMAAEMGVPAAALAGALILWTVLSAVGGGARAEGGAAVVVRRRIPPVNVAIVAGALSLVGWFTVYALSWPAATYYLYLVIFAAAETTAVGTAAFVVMEQWETAGADGGGGVRAVAIAGMVGALGMFVYDQINMALVTGGVALLFWMLLGTADAAWDRGRRGKTGGLIVAAVTLLAAAVLGLFAWLPTAGGTFAWDPDGAEYQYLRAMAAGDASGAESALNAALALAPRSTELRSRRIVLRMQRGEPVADDIRAIFAIDRFNAGVRVSLAMPDTDLPAAERAAALEEALKLDQQLAADEPKRLSAQQISDVQARIAMLRGSGR